MLSKETAKSIKKNYNILAHELKSALVEMISQSGNDEIKLTKKVKMPVITNYMKLVQTNHGVKKVPRQSVELVDINRLALETLDDDSHDVLFIDEYGHEYDEADIYGNIITAFTILDMTGALKEYVEQ